MPNVGKGKAVLGLLLNLVIPGLGTAVMTCLQEESCSRVDLLIALNQFLLTPYLLGHIWAIYWSTLVLKQAWQPQLKRTVTDEERAEQSDRGKFGQTNTPFSIAMQETPRLLQSER